MIWFFTRGSAQVDIEVRRGREPGTFELVIDYPDGSETVMRFREGRKLLRHALKMQRRLIRRGWAPASPTERAVARRARVSRPNPDRRRQRFWSRLQQRVSARWAATFGL